MDFPGFYFYFLPATRSFSRDRPSSRADPPSPWYDGRREGKGRSHAKKGTDHENGGRDENSEKEDVEEIDIPHEIMRKPRPVFHLAPQDTYRMRGGIVKKIHFVSIKHPVCTWSYPNKCN